MKIALFLGIKRWILNLPSDIASCHVLILSQAEMIAKLQITIKSLEARIFELEQRLGKNSQNSNKPPSSDGLSKPPPKPAFKKTKGTKGGQKGHRGNTLQMVETPDHIIVVNPVRCRCGHEFTFIEQSNSELVRTTQVFDLPDPKLVVTAYEQRCCTCQKCHSRINGKLPDFAQSPTQYGLGVRAFTSLLNNGYHLSFESIKSLFFDLFGYEINENTLHSNNIRVYDALAGCEEKVKERLLTAAVLHSDETGMRVKGKLHWLHVASNVAFTYFFFHAKRGKEAMQSPQSLLSKFKNILVHDCWTSYFGIEGTQHAICNAHILRELTALEEQGTSWAIWFKEFLLETLQLTRQNEGFTEQLLTPEQQQNIAQRFDELWLAADEIEPPPEKKQGKRGRLKATKGRNLLTRLKTHKKAVLAFVYNAQVPFTNNQAERDLRPAKTKQKVSNCFRTVEGGQRFARIFGAISSFRKQQLNVFLYLKYALMGINPFNDLTAT